MGIANVVWDASRVENFGQLLLHFARKIFLRVLEERGQRNWAHGPALTQSFPLPRDAWISLQKALRKSRRRCCNEGVAFYILETSRFLPD